MSSGAGLPGPKSCLQHSGEKLLERGKAGKEGGRKQAGRKEERSYPENPNYFTSLCLRFLIGRMGAGESYLSR